MVNTGVTKYHIAQKVNEPEFHPRKILLEDNEVHIWGFDIGKADTSASDYRILLSKLEKERASKFKFTEDRERFLWGRTLLKRLLGVYLGENPDTINLNYTPEGKPFLKAEGKNRIQFNVSHSGNNILLGFSRSPIGVDVEKMDNQVDTDRISRNFFSAEEWKLIESASGENKKDTFFEIWTKKEAVLKGIGKGLRIPLSNFSVIGDDGNVKWNPGSHLSSSGWFVSNINEIQSCKAAFATPMKEIEATYFSINDLAFMKMLNC